MHQKCSFVKVIQKRFPDKSNVFPYFSEKFIFLLCRKGKYDIMIKVLWVPVRQNKNLMIEREG